MKKIILCADDYGQNQAISQAIIALLKKNRLSATSCMTTSSLWPAHAEWLKPFIGQVDIGLHFNLTEGKSSLPTLIYKAYWRLLDEKALEKELHAQLDAFEAAMGRPPDFVDGHQHIHQLPVIRLALLKVYETRLRPTGCYIRCVRAKARSAKGLIIQLVGANTFKKLLMKFKIPHNTSFTGIYSFNDSKPYSRIFPRFLREARDGGLIMCHPGLASSESTDPIAKARFQEFLYLESDEFVMDCFKAGVTLSQFSKK